MRLSLASSLTQLVSFPRCDANASLIFSTTTSSPAKLLWTSLFAGIIISASRFLVTVEPRVIRWSFMGYG